MRPLYGVAFRSHNIPLRLPRGSVTGISVTLENTGTLPWLLHEPEGKRVDLVALWDGAVAATHTMPRPMVLPDETVTLHLPLSTPLETGSHELTIDLVHQSVAFFSQCDAAPLRLVIETDDGPAQRTDELYRRAQRLSPWYYQPTRGIHSSRDGKPFPTSTSKAQGCFLWDLEERRYIDYTSGWGCVLLGFAEPRVQRAVAESLETGAIVPFPYELEIEVAEMLVRDIPCAEMVVLGKNGSDVCTLAARLARAYTGKRKILYCGYHGWQDWWVEQFGFGATGIPARPEMLIHRFDGMAAFRALWENHRHDLAAVMIEPAGASQGIQGPVQGTDSAYLTELAHLAREAGALVIFDEIITGFRYPSGSAQKETGVIPDLACFGKALSNGMPLSALVGRAHIMQRSMAQSHYGPTFRGELYSLAAARAALQIYRSEPMAQSVWESGLTLQRGIERLRCQYGIAGAVTGPPYRFVLAFDEPDQARLDLKRTLYQQELLKAGVITYNGFLLPNYAHRQSGVIDATLAAVDRALGKVAEAESSGRFDAYVEIPLLT